MATFNATTTTTTTSSPMRRNNYEKAVNINNNNKNKLLPLVNAANNVVFFEQQLKLDEQESLKQRYNTLPLSTNNSSYPNNNATAPNLTISMPKSSFLPSIQQPHQQNQLNNHTPVTTTTTTTSTILKPAQTNSKQQNPKLTNSNITSTFSRLNELSSNLDRLQWPIRIRKLVNLNDYYKNNTCLTLQSNRYICIRDSVHSKLAIVDLQTSSTTVNNNNSNNKNMCYYLNVNVEMAIMHLTKKILAIKVKHLIQIVDLNDNKKLREHALSDDERDIVYWKWLTFKCLAFVTRRSVFHWSLFDTVNNEKPIKQFDLSERLIANFPRIVNYLVDASEKCFILIGRQSSVN